MIAVAASFVRNDNPAMPAPPRSDALPYALSFAGGLATCLAITLISGRKEAWDSSLYFVAGIPVMCAIAFAIAYAFPTKPWRWALAIAVGQSIAMLLGGGSLSLWPLAIVGMAVLSLPQLAAAIVGGKVSRRR